MTIIITATCIGGCGCDGLSLCRTVFCESHNHNIHGKVQRCQLSHSSTPEHTSGTTSSSASKIMHGTPSPPFQRRIPAWTNRMPPHWPKIGAARSSLSQTRAQPITSILNFWPLFCMKMNSRHGKIVENYPTAGERRKPAVKERGPWGKKHNLVGWLFIVNIYLSSQINKKMTTMTLLHGGSASICTYTTGAQTIGTTVGTTVFRGKFFQIPRACLPNSAANFP